jgi:hypothetical protein
MKNKDAELDRLLRQWTSPPIEIRSLERRVWQKIAESEESPWFGGSDWGAGWRRSWLGSALAASIGLAAIGAGIGAAELRMQSGREVSTLQSPGQSYFESINPVALARHEHR